MNSKFRLITLILGVILSFHFTGFAQETTGKTVTLVVSGDGSTKEDATKQALRSAIEQTFGTFVSANTEILNDEIIRDEIVTISSGNISNYKEISNFRNNDGSCSVTLEATVSIGKLTKYAQSKGVTAELASGTFAMNMKIRELNRKNEILAIRNLQTKLAQLSSKIKLFDYKISLSEPFVDDDKKYAVWVNVDIIPNQNLAEFRKIFNSTLKALSLSREEVNEYIMAHLPYTTYKIVEYESDEDFLRKAQMGAQVSVNSTNVKIYLRNDYGTRGLVGVLDLFLLRNELSFSVKDNIGTHIFFTQSNALYPIRTDEAYSKFAKDNPEIIEVVDVNHWSLKYYDENERKDVLYIGCFFLNIGNPDGEYERVVYSWSKIDLMHMAGFPTGEENDIRPGENNDIRKFDFSVTKNRDAGGNRYYETRETPMVRFPLTYDPEEFTKINNIDLVFDGEPSYDKKIIY